MTKQLLVINSYQLFIINHYQNYSINYINYLIIPTSI